MVKSRNQSNWKGNTMTIEQKPDGHFIYKDKARKPMTVNLNFTSEDIEQIETSEKEMTIHNSVMEETVNDLKSMVVNTMEKLNGSIPVGIQKNSHC